MEKLVRRPNAVILFISLSLLMMLTTGCQEIKPKAGIEAANKQCPIDMGETGKITSIVYDGENVVYTFYLNEEAANIKTLQKNPESMKTSLKIMFQNPNKEVKSLLDLVVKCKAGLQMIYIGKDSGEQVVCELTTDEIKEILNKDVDTTESDLAKLETQVQMANLQLQQARTLHHMNFIQSMKMVTRHFPDLIWIWLSTSQTRWDWNWK